jgi:hypothetical protein
VALDRTTIINNRIPASADLGRIQIQVGLETFPNAVAAHVAACRIECLLTEKKFVGSIDVPVSNLQYRTL